VLTGWLPSVGEVGSPQCVVGGNGMVAARCLSAASVLVVGLIAVVTILKSDAPRMPTTPELFNDFDGTSGCSSDHGRLARIDTGSRLLSLRGARRICAVSRCCRHLTMRRRSKWRGGSSLSVCRAGTCRWSDRRSNYSSCWSFSSLQSFLAIIFLLDVDGLSVRTRLISFRKRIDTYTQYNVNKCCLSFRSYSILWLD